MLRVLKRLLISCLICVLLVVSSIQAMASTGKPSNSLEVEVSASIEKGLVPIDLQGSYQTHITRAQYVLLALKVYEAAGKTTEITNAKPFTDCAGHQYEEQIVKAYNSGIIAGYGDGKFYPDQKISRQQVAVLIVNLLKRIAPQRDFTLKTSPVFTDGNKIGSWAVQPVKYCYENKIMLGVGQNRVDPLGNTTIEQSIALLYRIAKSEFLLDNPYGTIELNDSSVDSDTASASIVNAFVKSYGVETYTTISNLSKSPNIDITSLWEKSAVLVVNKNTISLNNTDFEKNLVALVHDINDDLFISSFKQLLQTYDNPEKAINLFEEYVIRMKAGEDITITNNISEKEVFVIESSVEGSGVVYTITYAQRY